MENIQDIAKKYKINVRTLGVIRGFLSEKYGEPNEAGDYSILENWFDILNENPYQIMELKNYNFKRADTIAQKLGFDMESPLRIIASVEHCVENTSTGDTILRFNTVIEKILTLLDTQNVKKVMDVIMNSNKKKNSYILLGHDLKPNKKNPYYITIKKWAYVEKGIWDMMKKAEKIYKNSPEIIKGVVDEIKEDLPFTLNEKQDIAVGKIPTSNINVLTGLGGCLPHGTEVLTKKGWIEIQNWNGQEIMEIETENKVGIHGSFKKPLKFHKYNVDQFYKINGQLIVSKYHNNLLEDEFGNFHKKTTEEIVNMEFIDFKVPQYYNGFEKKYMVLKGDTKDLIEEVNCGEFMYCFTTSTGNFLIRQNNKIYCTGNSGKSFTTNTILKTLDKLKETYTLLAPTGTASKVLSDMTGQNAMTIHRMFYSKYKIKTDWLIIDEASMLSLDHFDLLLRMLEDRSVKILLIGDINQLTPISAGSPFRDIINLLEIGSIQGQVVHLTEIMRSSDELAIAHICKMFTQYGQYTEDVLYKKHKGVEFYPLDKDNMECQILTILDKKGYKLEHTYILSSMNVREQGTNVINNFVQKTNKGKVLYSDRYKMYRKNDILMHTKNNGMLDIFNGERVRLISRKKTKKGLMEYKCKKLDDGKEVIYKEITLMNETMLSYSCSCHKSQGQTIENVIVVVPTSHSFMLNRNMIYTAFSRASKNLIVLYEKNALKYGSEKNEINKRKTFLREIFLRKKKKK